MQVFSSLDGELALNIFTFAPVSTEEVIASVEDMVTVQQYAAAIKRGEVTEVGIPTYDEKIFGEAALEAYRKRIRPEYAVNIENLPTTTATTTTKTTMAITTTYPNNHHLIFACIFLQAKADPRRFLIMREMYERVRDNDAASVHMEVANDQYARGFTSSTTGSQMAWISIATANVLPEVILILLTFLSGSSKLVSLI